MNIIGKIVTAITLLLKNIGALALSGMVLLIVISVIARQMRSPVLGDYELVQILMLTLIMSGLAYTETTGGHVNIGIVVDRFSPRTQQMFVNLNAVLTIVVCLLISWISFNRALDLMLISPRTSNLLQIPFFPFKFLIALGFLLWGCEAVRKIRLSIITLSKGKSTHAG